jgi:anti-sigma-K factor RskA
MEANALHDLTAAYALDALEPEDARAYEAHLAHCERCRDELTSFSEAAGALAYAVEAPAPPAHLRERILERARSERSNVVPLRPRWAYAAAAAAAIAACAAIGLGLWAASLSGKLDRRERALARQEQVAKILAQPDARAIAFEQGTLVVTRAGEGALVLRRLPPAGAGRTYEAWVAAGGAPEPAGLFDGGEVVSLPLERRVPDGALVMVTEERAGGTDAPTSAPFVRVKNTA